MEALDLQIVQCLLRDRRAPFRRIAEALSVSEQTVARRYRGLLAEGALRVQVQPDERVTGQHRRFVRVQCRPDAAAALADSMAARGDVSWVSITSGGSEIVCVAFSDPSVEDGSVLARLPRTRQVLSFTAFAVLHMHVGSSEAKWMPSARWRPSPSCTGSSKREPESGTGACPPPDTIRAAAQTSSSRRPRTSSRLHPHPRLLWCASMTLRLVLAAYGLESVRPYRVDAGRNNEHWYVGTGLVLRRYSPFRSDAAIDYEHAIVGQLRERGWPVAVPIPSGAGRMVVVDDGRRYSLFPRLAGRRGIPGRPRQPRELGRLLGRLHRDLATVSVAGPPDAFPRILEMPADPAWQRLDALDDPVLSGLIRRKLAEVRAVAGSAAGGRPGVQLVHGDWHDGNILYQGGTVSGILDFDFAHPDLPLVDVAIAALIPEVEDAAQIAVGYFGARSPAEHELDLIATAQRARGLGHVAFFVRRHADGDHGALDQIRLGVDLLLRAEQRWPALRAAILSGTTG